MNSVNKATIAWSIAIVAVGAGFFTFGLSFSGDVSNSPTSISETGGTEFGFGGILEPLTGTQTAAAAPEDAQMFWDAIDDLQLQVNSIVQLATGPAGSEGPQGPAGTQGVPGDPGGTPGADGAQGPQGEQGLIGSQGADGVQGPAGSQGLGGSQGPTGPQGPVGAAGSAGPRGAGAGLSCDNQNVIAAAASGFLVGPECVDVDIDGFGSDIDCNDNDSSINPGATEIMNQIDNNCNNLIDEVISPISVEVSGTIEWRHQMQDIHYQRCLEYDDNPFTPASGCQKYETLHSPRCDYESTLPIVSPPTISSSPQRFEILSFDPFSVTVSGAHVNGAKAVLTFSGGSQIDLIDGYQTITPSSLGFAEISVVPGATITQDVNAALFNTDPPYTSCTGDHAASAPTITEDVTLVDTFLISIL